jgi:hypothetical protein
MLALQDKKDFKTLYNFPQFLQNCEKDIFVYLLKDAVV